MPELPEVEITRRGIAPAITGRQVTGVVVRNAQLRWPIPACLADQLTGRTIRLVSRRAKYLLLNTGQATLLMHLGMSGSLRLVPAAAPVGPHDHVDVVFGDIILRLRDPRRFGAVLWAPGDGAAHPLLAHLGIEPFSEALTGEWLHRHSRGRHVGIKQLLMDHRLVVGIGNIYANEALFHAGIHPRAAAGRISLPRYQRLVPAVRRTLEAALLAGGSSLRDFVHSDGASGYFQQNYQVYGRDGQPCRNCGRTIRVIRMGQRSTFYCPACQR